MTLGQEFSTYAVMLGEDEQRLSEAGDLICEINMGATAIGTGINSHPDYAAMVCQHSARPRRASGGHRGEPDRGDPGLRQLRAAFRRAEAGCRQAVEDLQRLAAAVIGAPGRPRRDQSAADAGRLQHHARQGQSGDSGGRQPDRLRGDRQRRHGHVRGRGRPVAAQRFRADHRPQPVQERQPSARRLPDARRADASTASRPTATICAAASNTRSASSPRSIPISATPTPPRSRGKRWSPTKASTRWCWPGSC